MDREFIRIKAAAALLGVTPLTLRNWDKKGLLAAYRHPVNNYRLYRSSDIDELLARLARPIPPSPAKYALPEAIVVRESIPAIIEETEEAEVRPAPIQKLAITFEDEV